MENLATFFGVRYKFTLQNMPTNHLNASTYYHPFILFISIPKKQYFYALNLSRPYSIITAQAALSHDYLFKYDNLLNTI